MGKVSFVLNHQAVSVEYDDGISLLELLRSNLAVTSPKNGCSQGFCGACTVFVDGHPALACLKKPEHVEGRKVVTLEGLPTELRALLARSFVQEGAIQCGFCTPGIVMRAAWLIDKGRAADRQAVNQALSSHLCRCTGYLRITDAILTAGEAHQAGGVFSNSEPRRTDFFGKKHGNAIAPVREGQRHPLGVGANAPRYRGLDQALGKKPFVGDLRFEGMLHGAMVLAEHPRGRIIHINADQARAMPGVVRIIVATDVPGERFVGLINRDWPIFVDIGETTRCVGDVIALVVAATQNQARQAAGRVLVDYEILPPITSPEQALAVDAPALHPKGNLLEVCAFARGNVDRALANSTHVVCQRYQTQRIEHAFVEPEACVAIIEKRPDADGHVAPCVRVYSQGQGVHEDQTQIAAILALPKERVLVELVSNGGAFGGKEDLSVQGQTALAAYLLGRPIRVALTREQSILMHPKRHPLTLDYTVGSDAEGRLTAARVRIVGDTGAYASVGAKVLERAAGHSCGPYRVPNVDVEAKAVYTNNPPAGAMRGFGVNQAAFAIEGIMDSLAERVGIDRYEIRERNILRPGDHFATGQIMTSSCGALQTLQAVKDVFRSARYAGIACGLKNTGIGNGMADIGRVVIQVLADQSLQLVTGYTEMGQGLYTILCQVVAHETGLDPEIMGVVTRSDLAVECGMTTASRATALATMAAQRAARQLATAIEKDGLEKLGGREFIGEFICDITVKPGTKVDNPVTHMSFGYATQVVILDDQGRLEKVVAAHDVGRAINPLACVQQIEGAIHMGLGYALSEELPCTDGRPDSLLLRDLGIIPAKAMPEVEVILIEVADDVGGYGAKGVGEIGLVPTAAATASALWSFDGICRTELPMRDAPAARALWSAGAKTNPKQQD